jgi:hypothetical protein
MAIFRESFALALSSSTSFFLAQKRSQREQETWPDGGLTEKGRERHGETAQTALRICEISPSRLSSKLREPVPISA